MEVAGTVSAGSAISSGGGVASPAARESGSRSSTVFSSVSPCPGLTAGVTGTLLATGFSPGRSTVPFSSDPARATVRRAVMRIQSTRAPTMRRYPLNDTTPGIREPHAPRSPVLPQAARGSLPGRELRSWESHGAHADINNLLAGARSKPPCKSPGGKLPTCRPGYCRTTVKKVFRQNRSASAGHRRCRAAAVRELSP